MASRIVYFHGFASGPSSRKAQFFRDQFARKGISLEIPNLDEGDFENLTISGQLGVIDRLAAGEPITLMGSSMGGYLAALYAARHPEVDRLVLLAPAFRFAERWQLSLGEEAMAIWRRTGKLPVFHYSAGQTRFLGTRIIDDAFGFEAMPDFRQPALILHGEQDPVVPAAYSQEFTATHPNARLLTYQAGHELVEVLDSLWAETWKFLADVLT
jgi:uncharacterized protein